MSTPLLRTRSLTRQYGSGASTFTALDSVNLSFEKGTSTAIIGKSGSGKSTLMHLLSLLDRPTSGAVEINGQNTSTLSAKQLNELRNTTYGFVFQQFFLLPQRSLLDNVSLPLLIAGVPKAERNRRARHALELVGLADRWKSRATDLSGGQKQRIVIARALVNEPKVIFADEPTGNLDSATGAMVEKLLFGLQRDHGITLIIVTHDQDLADRCENQIHLRDGQLVVAKHEMTVAA